MHVPRLLFGAVLGQILAGCHSEPGRSPGPSGPSGGAVTAVEGAIEHRAPNPNPSAAYRWVDIMLEVAGNDVERFGARPTIISRQMAIPMTAMFDAWAAYDDTAVGTRLGGALRRPPPERTLANQEAAIAYAVHRTLCDLFPPDGPLLARTMRSMGYDPDDVSTDPTTPPGIGNTVAAAVLEHRRRDGSNQFGDEAASNGAPYGDYTGYQPRNLGAVINDPDHWGPIPFDDGRGGTVLVGSLTPHWHLVEPFALDRADHFRPPPPPLVGSAQLLEEVDECIALNAGLTIQQKAIVEFMRDGPRSTGQSGHWLQFAQDVSRLDHHDLDQDVKLFFVIANAAFDAFIACWDAKRAYDSSRPWHLVRHYYKGRTIEGWLGPCRGTGPIPAGRWHPYSPASFVTPPFPGYPSGHSTVSGACATMLARFSGRDRFGAFERRRAGIYTEPECSPPGSAEVILLLPTFSATAEMAGISRIMGGYHIRSDNIAGLALGRAVAEHTWPIYQAYFDGTAPPPPPAAAR